MARKFFVTGKQLKMLSKTARPEIKIKALTEIKRRKGLIMAKRKQVNVKGFLRKVPGQRAKVRVKPQRRKIPRR